jgi:hypothetical protein
MSIIGRFGVVKGIVRSAQCTVSESVGDCVYLSGSIGALDIVRKADPTDYAKLPTVRVIISKSSTTQCSVQWEGETPAIFSGLFVGKTYFLGSDAKLVSNPPDPSVVDTFVQPIAMAIAADRAYVKPSINLTKLISG